MSNLLTAKFLPQFKLGTKAVLCAVLLIAMNTALVVGAGYWSLTSAFNDRALREIEVNLRTLALAFAETAPDAKITMRDGAVVRAEIPKMPEFRDHAIVDRAVSYVGGNATLFVFDDASGQFVRRSTNVKKENGDRAVGTQLAADHPAQALLRRRTRRASGAGPDPAGRPSRHEAAHLGYALADGARRRPERRRDRVRGSRRRDRRDRPHGRSLQEQFAGAGAAAQRAGSGHRGSSRAAQIRPAQLRRRIPRQRRRHSRQGADVGGARRVGQLPRHALEFP